MSSAWISAIASVSSCRRCSAEPLPGRDQPHGERRAGVLVRRARRAGRSPAAQASSIGSISACSASIASSVARPSSSARSSSSGQRPASSPRVVVVQRVGEELPALRQRRQARRSADRGGAAPPRRTPARSRRKAWCITYIIVMSTGPGWAAVWPGSRICVGPVGVVSVRHRSLLLEWASTGSRSSDASGVDGGEQAEVVVGDLGADAGQHPVEPGGHPPVPAAEQRHGGRHQDHPDQGRVEQDRDGHADAELLDDDVDLGGEAQEDGDHDRGGAGDHPAGRGQAADHAAVRVAGAPASPRGSARAGTPRSPSTGRTGSRTSGSAPSSRPASAWSSPSSSVPQPHWKTATITPYAAPMESRFITAALSGTTTDRNTMRQQQHGDADHEADDQPQPLGEQVGDVGEQRRVAGDLDAVGHLVRGSTRPGPWLRSSVGPNAGSALKIAQRAVGRDDRLGHRRDVVAGVDLRRPAPGRLGVARPGRGRRRSGSGRWRRGRTRRRPGRRPCGWSGRRTGCEGSCGQVRMSSTGSASSDHHQRGAERPGERVAADPGGPARGEARAAGALDGRVDGQRPHLAGQQPCDRRAGTAPAPGSARRPSRRRRRSRWRSRRSRRSGARTAAGPSARPAR